MKVLIVEDNPVDRKLAGMVLTSGGHVVTEATSAEAAIDSVAKESYDVMLLDLRLPGTDGLALVRMLKADAVTSHIAIVAVTAYEERYPRGDLVAAGCDAWIAKPIDTRQLVRALEDVVKKKRSL